MRMTVSENYQRNKIGTSDITNAELTLVAIEVQKSCNQKV